jgi:NADH-quinone oxidoreductase E subunit
MHSAGVPFHFTPENQAKLDKLIDHYPEGRQQSAVIAALDLAQRQNGGWVSREVIEEVARYLAMPAMHVYEIATFYTMFNLHPVGKYVVQVCTTTPCWLRGSDEVLATCQRQAEQYGPEMFTVIEVECLGACVNGPVVQINDDFYEDLDAAETENILTALAAGKSVMPGSCKGRQGSAPEGGPTVLTKDKE